MRKVTIAIDSFKGSLTAAEAAAALAEGVGSVVDGCDVRQVPLADGGEGSSEVLTRALGGSTVEVEVFGARGERTVARYGIVGGTKAVVDVASAVGLTLLESHSRTPVLTSSWGVGELIADAIERGAREVVLCLGGSSTNDCALGALAALGWHFADAEGVEIARPAGGDMARVESLRLDPQSVASRIVDGRVRLTLATDVLSPLCGPTGAARVFAPQKGATAEDVEALERGAMHLAEVVLRHTGRDMLSVRGGGAAGGMGAGMWALLGAGLADGAELVMDAVGLDNELADSDLVITGEGRIDSQTLLGKLPLRVAERAHRVGGRVVAVGGTVEEWASGPVEFDDVVAATPEGMTLEEAMRPEVAKANLRRVGTLVAGKHLL